jgi:hypothetical protein
LSKTLLSKLSAYFEGISKANFEGTPGLHSVFKI